MNQSLLKEARVLPVVVARDVGSTLALTRSLLAGGMKIIELTLRTPVALEAIRAIKAEIPGTCIAAGTVTNPAELAAAIDAGADFHVSPGLTPRLLDAVKEAGVDILPGVATPSELMQGMEYGLDCFKLFPAVAVGGITMLRSIGGPFPNVKFCPTGGLNPANFRDFLALDNVICCGGSWMVDDKLIEGGRWDEIERLAREAMA
ncbi:MAG: 2-dehydro-3-deoxyphosphogluconate aldolase/(4S)-4-hydroxy-2-oxoglutarate aldolase [Halieaceae bacterium]|jgi:2-dehydro-3-deoxyphosphogluconate aldolase/(4S)-4-hydroxy-2-oxoglutarate aldolase